MDAQGTESLANGTDCSQAQGPRPAALDVLRVVDRTGATSEVRIWREPCVAVQQRGKGPLTAIPELLSWLDDHLK
jgi:hypothetical protein